MIREYERLLETVESGKPGIIADTGIITWYTAPLQRDRNWWAFHKYLTDNQKWKSDSISTVDHASTKVVGATPRPNRKKWISKGLVVGYVQSGKTTNFTAVISKSADVGYRLVIVLSGIHNGLRRQTQERLATQLKTHNPDAWIELTTLDDDFRKPTMTLASLLHNRDGGTALAVVKKNKAPLARLGKWIQEASDQNALADLRVLIIDDEADQASVATPTINPLIIDIIQKLPRCTYIGYTATPFANVLIDPAADDLYPADFILNLPQPDPKSGYFGADRVFGRDAVEGEEANGTELDGYDMIRIIPDSELTSLRPLKRRDIPSFQPILTASVMRATEWFWLATAARRVRGDYDHSSMLIHTHQSTVVHERFKNPLIEFRDSVLREARLGSPELLRRLEELWNSESERVPAENFADLKLLTFDEVFDKFEEAVAATKVVIDNSSSDDRLDYTAESQVAIAVGGNTLSRGLTLEGLVVSLFVRSSTAYDTLLQMARWFGYRRGYEDLPRIWMTNTLRDWFRHLATVEREIRLDIERYEKQGFTPLQIGVRIRTHPKLAVTAKMGAYKPQATSFSDQRVQVRYFHENDHEWLQANYDVANALVRDARADGSQPEPDTQRRAVLLRNVSADRILRFLREYRVHNDSPDINGKLLAAYIEKEHKVGKLKQWTVAVMAPQTSDNGTNTVSLGGIQFAPVTRAVLKNSLPFRADIKTLMSKEHRVVDLAISPSDARQKNTEIQLVDMRNADAEHRDKGLLLLYPINPDSRPLPENEDTRRAMEAAGPVVGLAMVFPASDNSKDKFVAVDLSGVDVDLSPSEEDFDAEDADRSELLTALEQE